MVTYQGGIVANGNITTWHYKLWSYCGYGKTTTCAVVTNQRGLEDDDNEITFGY